MEILNVLLIVVGVLALLFLFRWGYIDLVRRISLIKTPNSEIVSPKGKPSEPTLETKDKNIVHWKKSQSNYPYQVQVKNTTDKKQKVVIFGYSRFFKEVNYGSDTGVVITPTQCLANYSEILSESAFQPLHVEYIKIHAKSSDQFQNEFYIKGHWASGCAYSSPLRVVREDYATYDRNQKNMLIIPVGAWIDHSTHITFDIDPNEEMIVTFFSDEQINLCFDRHEELHVIVMDSDSMVDNNEALSEMDKKIQKRRIEFDKIALEKFKKENPDCFPKEEGVSDPNSGNEKESFEVNSENIEDIKEAVKESEVEIKEELQKIPKQSEVIQVIVENLEEETVMLTGEQLISGNVNPLVVTPSIANRTLSRTLSQLNIQDVEVELVRLQCKHILSNVGKVGNSSEMLEGGRFITDNLKEGGILNITYLPMKSATEKLNLKDFHIEIKSKSRVIITFFTNLDSLN